MSVDKQASRRVSVAQRAALRTRTIAPFFGIFLLTISGLIVWAVAAFVISQISFAGDSWWERLISMCAVIPFPVGISWILASWGTGLLFLPTFGTWIDGFLLIQRAGFVRRTVDLNRASLRFTKGTRGEVRIVIVDVVSQTSIELIVKEGDRLYNADGLRTIVSTLDGRIQDEQSTLIHWHLNEILQKMSPGKSHRIPVELITDNPPARNRDALMVRLLFGVFGSGLFLFGLLAAVTEFRIILWHTTVAGTVIGSPSASSSIVRFYLPNGTERVSSLWLATKGLPGGTQVIIDYVSSDPTVARLRGDYTGAIYAALTLVAGTAGIWRLFARRFQITKQAAGPMARP